MKQDYQYEHELSADEFLEAPDIVIERVETPEIKPGSYVYVRSITAEERGEIEAAGARFKDRTEKGKDDPFARDFTVTFAYLAMVDKDGRRLFSKKEDVARLKKKNAALVARIAARAQRLSGFTKEDMEKLEKNFVEAQADDSPSV